MKKFNQKDEKGRRHGYWETAYRTYIQYGHYENGYKVDYWTTKYDNFNIKTFYVKEVNSSSSTTMNEIVTYKSSNGDYTSIVYNLKGGSIFGTLVHLHLEECL